MTKAITEHALKKRGRKPMQPPRDAATRIEALAADGWSILGIARQLGTYPDTFRRWLDEFPELQTAIDNGRENERQALHNMLYRQAMEKGNSTAAMFLLKARHGYREGDQSETGNKVQINFQLPGALSMSEFQNANPKVIDANTSTNEPVSTERIAIARGS